MKRLAAEGRDAKSLRVGFTHPCIETGTAQHEHEPMFAHQFDEHLYGGPHVDGSQPFNEFLRTLRGDPASTPVRNGAVACERAEVTAYGNILRTEREIDANRL